jgi:ectoine hydroxylase-related dioxygenase (phytanoyl-CoA dioxygenase family)
MATATENPTGSQVDSKQIETWIEQFHRDGFLYLPEILSPEWCRELRNDLDRMIPPGDPDSSSPVIELHKTMFETSKANLRLFDMEPIVSLAEQLIGETTHVIHNNSFRTPPGGGLSGWHQDDRAHFIVTEGEPPTNVHLPVLFFTCNFYLTDVESVDQGAFQAVRGSHLIGSPCPADVENSKWADRIDTCVGGAGTVMMFNNQVWHHGAVNQSDRTRYVTQVTYGRRIIGHMYPPFMNYQMPEHVYLDADERLKRLLGFLPSGAYG